MASADQYRVKAGDMTALARAETDPFQKAEYERLSQAYLRLAEQAERNSQMDLVYEPPARSQAHQHQHEHHQQQQQQQQQPQPKRDDE